MTLAIIMAGGENTRWEQPTPKEIAPILGEPVIARTVRMLRERDIQPIVVTHKPEVMAAVPGCEFWQTRRRFYVEHTWNLASRWQKRNVLLFGDCAYTNAALDKLLTAPVPIWWFGRKPEMFGMAWTDRPETRRVFSITAHDAYVVAGKRVGCCSTVYWQWINRRSGSWREIGPSFTTILDETGDMDTPEQWRTVSERFARMRA